MISPKMLRREPRVGVAGPCIGQGLGLFPFPPLPTSRLWPLLAQSRVAAGAPAVTLSFQEGEKGRATCHLRLHPIDQNSVTGEAGKAVFALNTLLPC